MDILFAKLLEIFSIEYIFTVIMASYCVIKIIDVLNKEKAVPTWAKRVVTFVVGLITLVAFIRFSDVPFKSLVSSYFAACFIYDTTIKWLIKKLNIDYKKIC